MNTKFKKLLAVAVIAMTSAAFSGGAYAGGVGGDILNVFVPGLGTAADRVNHQLGNPVDHAAAAAANVVVPGSQAALEAAWALQRSGALNQPGFPQQPTPFPASQQSGQPFGNFCSTPAGRFGPGPVNPIGMECYVGMPFGTVVGRVTQ